MNSLLMSMMLVAPAHPPMTPIHPVLPVPVYRYPAPPLVAPLPHPVIPQAMPHPVPAYPQPVPAFPGPVIVSRPVVQAPMTLEQFAHCFKPTPGLHNVCLIHPKTNCPVHVSFVLPANCGCPRVCHGRRYIEFKYSHHKDVEIHFRHNGTVDVHY